MLTGYALSCTPGRSVLGIGSGAVRFLTTAEYATYRYLRCVVNVMLLSYYAYSYNGRVVRAFASVAVDFGLIPSRVKPMTLKLVFTASLLDAQH